VKSVSEKADAVIVGLYVAGHALQPPMFANAFGDFRARTVKAVEGHGEIFVELRAISGKAGAELIEGFHGQAAGVTTNLCPWASSGLVPRADGDNHSVV